MKPDTILEALIGKIAKDEDCVAANVKPETKLEYYVKKIGRDFEPVPRTSPLNAGGYLMSAGTAGAIWVKPLDVMFTINNGVPYCSKSYEEIVGAINANQPIDAYFVATNVRYPLTLSMIIQESGLYFWTNVTPYIDDSDQWALTKISCIRTGETVEIETDGL